MADKRQHPRFLGLGLGSIIGIILSLFVGTVVFLTPTLFYLFANMILFIPDRLGLVAPITPGEITKVSAPGSYDIQLLQGGNYSIFADAEKTPVYEIVLESKVTGDQIVAETTSNYAAGDDGYFYALSDRNAPVYKLRVLQPGFYSMSAQYMNLESGPRTTLTLMPDISARNDTICVLSALIQGAILVIAGRAVYYRVNRDRLQAEAEAKRQKSRRFKAWLGEEKEETE